MRSRQRGVVWVDVSRTPLLDGSGRPNGYSFVVRDITEKRAAMEKMAFTAAYVEIEATYMVHEDSPFKTAGGWMTMSAMISS